MVVAPALIVISSSAIRSIVTLTPVAVRPPSLPKLISSPALIVIAPSSVLNDWLIAIDPLVELRSRDALPVSDAEALIVRSSSTPIVKLPD